MLTNEKNVTKKTIRALLFVFFAICMLMPGMASEVQAARWETEIGVEIHGAKYQYSYIDSKGNKILEDNNYNFDVDKEAFPKNERGDGILDFKEIPGYELTGCKVTIVPSGREITLLEDKYLDWDNYLKEELDDLYQTYSIELMYIRMPIDYDFNVKYVDTANHEIKSPYKEEKNGVGVEFSIQSDDLEGYQYKGYYYENKNGEVGAFSKGSANDLLADSNVTITTQSSGKDADVNTGSYDIYLVYNPAFKVTYDGNGGEGMVTDSNKYLENDKVTTLSSGDINRDEHIFMWWNTSADGTGTSYNPGEVFEIKANTTLYAQWFELENIGYSVTYDANKGEGTVTDSNIYELYDVVKVLGGKDLSREGYTFTGWNTEADGSGLDCKVDSTFEISSDITLFAQWSKTEKDDNKTDDKKQNSNTNTNTNTNTPFRTNYSGTTATTSKSVETGDQSTILLYIVGIFAGAVVIAVLYQKRKLKKK